MASSDDEFKVQCYQELTMLEKVDVEISGYIGAIKEYI